MKKIRKTIKNISTVKKVFHSQGTFPQLRKCSTNKKISHKNMYLIKKFSTNKEVYHKQKIFLDQGNFPQSRKFCTNKDFSIVNKNFCKQRSKRPSGSQNYRSIQYWFLCKNIFNFLMFVGNKRSYILNWTISFLSTCELSLLSIKSLILYKVLTECT